MITQNPIIGRARKKLGAVYSRTLYGKNVLQTCPPPTKGHQTQGQLAVCNAFGKLSQLSNQIDTSLLNSIYYAAPQGRSRRAEWCRQLGKGLKKTVNGWDFDPNMISILGSNSKVSETALTLNVASTKLSIPFSQLSAVGSAILTEIPCLILIDPTDNICISLLGCTKIEGENIVINNLSSTLIDKDVWIFPLWAVNVGTAKNPVLAYGSFQKMN